VDIALVGGADELSPILYSCYNSFFGKIKSEKREALTLESGGGLVLGEGAGMIVMERGSYARERGADIYGFLRAGIITGGRATIGHYEVGGEQMARAMRLASEEAGVDPEGIDQINVSANFSHELDHMEHRQLVDFFGKQQGDLMVTPIKYLLGDFGGGGIIRAAATLLSLHHQEPLPTVAVDTLLGDARVPPVWHTNAEGTPRTALMTSSTFGGGSASLVFAR
jgi:3-oxoacyl-(acyl-carrier-protein) synthase